MFLSAARSLPSDAAATPPARRGKTPLDTKVTTRAPKVAYHVSPGRRVSACGNGVQTPDETRGAAPGSTTVQPPAPATTTLLWASAAMPARSNHDFEPTETARMPADRRSIPMASRPDCAPPRAIRTAAL